MIHFLLIMLLAINSSFLNASDFENDDVLHVSDSEQFDPFASRFENIGSQYGKLNYLTRHITGYFRSRPDLEGIALKDRYANFIKDNGLIDRLGDNVLRYSLLVSKDENGEIKIKRDLGPGYQERKRNRESAFLAQQNVARNAVVNMYQVLCNEIDNPNSFIPMPQDLPVMSDIQVGLERAPKRPRIVTSGNTRNLDRVRRVLFD